MLAARELFSTNGYDAATLRQICAAAGLGFGTIFNYVSNKRDLIFLIFNEEMDSLTDEALSAPRAEHTFLEKILSVTEPHYRLFAKDPVLSRILLSEILLPTEGFHFERYLDIRGRLIRGIEQLIAEAQESGEISSMEGPEIVARLIFFTFSSALRWWLASPDSQWRTGQNEFGRMLRLQLAGLQTNTAVARRSARAARGKSKKAVVSVTKL